MAEPWRDLCARKKAEQKSRIPKKWLIPGSRLPGPEVTNYLDIPRTCGLLSAEELRLTEGYDATALLQELMKGRVKSEDAVRAFCKRAAIANQLTNCLTEIFFEDGLKRARELDEHLKRHGKPIGPLHGLPVSLKDSFRVPGYDSTIGVASLAFKPSTTYSPLAQLLLDAGAVLYCKTNVPMTMGSTDSDNHVFGRVLNPLNTRVTAGGSSGGEGALLAMRGSVLGVGTDVGGSIRAPAFCSGVYGVKPSWQRVPFSGQEGAKEDGGFHLGLIPSAGPLARSLRDCEMFLRVVGEMKAWEYDYDIVPQGLDTQGPLVPKNETVFGVIRTDGICKPLPPVMNVLDEVVTSLQRAGIETVEIDATPVLKQTQAVANHLMAIDGGNYTLDLIEQTKEPLVNWLRSRMKRGEPMSLKKLTHLHAKKQALQKEFARYWKTPTPSGRPLTALICPVAPHPVPPPDRWNSVGYCSSFVLLDCPAGTVPVRTLDGGDLGGELVGEPLGSWDKVNRELWSVGGLEKEGGRSVYVGSNMSVQVVVPRLSERTLLGAMGVVDEAVKREKEGGSKAKL